MTAEEEMATGIPNSAADPFASDLFAPPSRNGRLATADTVAGTNEGPALVQFRDRLKRITSADAQASLAMASLPEGVSGDVVTRVLAPMTQTPERDVQIRLVSIKESEPTGAASFATGGPRAFAVLSVQPDALPLFLEVDAGLASMIVDRTLGGDAKLPCSLRALSPIETAVVEFLCLSIVREVNKEAGMPLISLAAISSTGPALGAANQKLDPVQLAQTLASVRFLKFTFGMKVGAVSGVAKIYCTPDCLAGLKASEARRTDLQSAGLIDTRIDRLARVIPEVSARVEIGRVEVTAGELMSLELGDMLVFDRPSLHFSPAIEPSLISGTIRVVLADGACAITGKLSQLAPDAPPDSLEGRGSELHRLAMTVEAILAEQHEEGVEIEMPMEDTAQFAQRAAVLEGLLLTVVAQIAARRMKLAEIADLRVGQIIDLGCETTDRVDLLVDGRRVARGELVDVQGRLGVRISEIAG